MRYCYGNVLKITAEFFYEMPLVYTKVVWQQYVTVVHQ